eukprot:scaffold78569_cov77-Cyclotella_meneghiniana.AAC.1
MRGSKTAIMRVAPDKMQLVRFDWRVRAEVVRSPLGVPHTPSSTIVMVADLTLELTVDRR